MALLLHKKEPAFWNGAVLVAPMCKVKQFALNFQVGFLLVKLWFYQNSSSCSIQHC